MECGSNHSRLTGGFSFLSVGRFDGFAFDDENRVQNERFGMRVQNEKKARCSNTHRTHHTHHTFFAHAGQILLGLGPMDNFGTEQELILADFSIFGANQILGLSRITHFHVLATE